MAVQCPNCACKHCPASNTYTDEIVWKGRKMAKVRRRRACRNCGTAFYTVESLEEDLLAQELDSTTTTRPLPPASDGMLPNPFLR